MNVVRVLHVVTMMDRAGLETMIMNYYRNIDKRKLQFDFLVHREGIHDFDEEIKRLGGRIFVLPSVNPLNTNGYLNAIDTFFRNHHEYSIVHSHLDCLSYYPLKYAKKYNIPIRIAHSHTSKIDVDYKYFIKLFLKPKIKKYATHLMACSNEAGKWMFNSDDFMIVNNAIDCKKFVVNESMNQIKRDELNLEDYFVIGHVGRFVPLKNHKFILKVFENVKKYIPKSKLVLIGDGIIKKEIEEIAKTKNMYDDIIFLGNKTNVYEYLQVMNVFIFPSLFEGLGISLIEAQAAGIKCFATSGGVPCESNICDLVTYLSLDNPDEWAIKICECLNYRKEDMTEVIKNKNYDIKSEALKLQQFYLNSVEEKIDI